MKRSPIRFRMGLAAEEDEAAPEPVQPAPEEQLSAPPEMSSQSVRGPVGTPFGMGQTRSMTTMPPNLPRPPRKEMAMPFIGEDQPTFQPSSRIFQLQVNAARARFRDHIDTGHYHGSFALDGKSAIQEDLVKRVPVAGLSAWDWRAVEKPWRIVRKEKEMEREGLQRKRSLSCLLYTSPSPRDGLLSRMPSSA